jgi:Transcriptional regulator PadR-like family
MRREQLKGHVDLLLLSALAGGPAHGYAVIGALRERSAQELNLPEGTVYPALHRLEEGGLLRSYGAEQAGRCGSGRARPVAAGVLVLLDMLEVEAVGGTGRGGSLTWLRNTTVRKPGRVGDGADTPAPGPRLPGSSLVTMRRDHHHWADGVQHSGMAHRPQQQLGEAPTSP